MPPQYLIWSIEQNRWWKPARLGYTHDRAEAGRYGLEEAIAICEDANRWNLDQNAPPNEAVVPEPTTWRIPR